MPSGRLLSAEPFQGSGQGIIASQGCPTKVFTDAILSRTFNAEMRVVRDQTTGNLLVAEAGSHGPFADLVAS